MSGDFGLTIDGVDATPRSEWNATWQEVVNGVGQASVTVQNRANDPALDVLVLPTIRRPIIKMTSGSWVLYEGESVTPELDLPPGFPWRRWKIGATDWNTLLALRLIGAPTGGDWLSTDGGLTFLCVDPDAYALGTDAGTVVGWFENFIRAPDGGAFDTGTYVGSYIPNTILNPPPASLSALAPMQATLRSAFDTLRGLGGFPIYGPWIDPDRKVHWIAYPTLMGGGGGILAMGMPQDPGGVPVAPAIITDDHPDGITSIGARDLKFKPDLTYSPQQIYVTGVNTFVFNGGAVIYQGTGWAHDAREMDTRQMAVDAQALTVAQRDAVGDAYAAYQVRPQMRIALTIGGRLDEGGGLPIMDGWRAGQLATIIDARLPPSLNGQQWPIQRLSGSLKTGRKGLYQLALELGDGAIERFSQKYQTQAGQTILTPRQPSNQHLVYFQNINPGPGETQTLTSQMVDPSGNPVRGQGVQVEWQMVATDDSGSPVIEGSFDPVDAVTNPDGRTQTRWTTGPDLGIHYQIKPVTLLG